MEREARVPLAAQPRAMTVAVAASMLAHAIVLVITIDVLRARFQPTIPVIVFPISLVGRSGAPGEGAPAAALAPPTAVPTPQPVPTEAQRPIPRPVALAHPKATARPTPDERPTPTATASQRAPSNGGDAGTAIDGAGSGRGAGGGPGSGGGSGGAGASPGYGTNPEPPYPILARRLGLEGEVVLRVFVAADGRPTDVVVIESSGHTVLDDSARETIRTRWRFVPATRGGVPVDDTVQVPIRFRRTS